jgi:hypothetical protein
MSNDQYNTSEPKCNIKKRSHENVINDSGEIALEMECFGVWLYRAVETGVLSNLSKELQLELQYAGYLLSDTAADLRASNKGDV